MPQNMPSNRYQESGTNTIEVLQDMVEGPYAVTQPTVATTQESAMVERQKERDKIKKGSMRMQYLRKLKLANKTNRFNEDLESEVSHVLSLGNSGNAKRTIKTLNVKYNNQ